MTDQLLLLVVLLMLSGFFSSAETALFSISGTRARHLAKSGDRTLRLIKRMKDDPHRLLSTVLIGNNVVNVGASALATSLTLEVTPHFAVSLATGVMTFLILVFGEVFPKSIATRNNVLIARITIYPIFWLSIIFFPLVLFLNFIPQFTGKIKRATRATEEELMTFVEVVEEEGEIKEEEKELIYNIFEFDDTYASEIMTPRADMFVLDADEPLPLGELVASGFTRVPVIEGDIDHVAGILNIKDLFRHYAAGPAAPEAAGSMESMGSMGSMGSMDVRKIMKPPYFVPENKKLDSLLAQFKKRKHHMAIVVDEHGGVSGLITLEDVLEEIVGDISDETDRDEPGISQVESGVWVVPGKSDIDDVNDQLNMGIPDSAQYDTFSGYVLDMIGRIPRENEEIPDRGFTIVVSRMDGNRISEFIVHQRGSDRPSTDAADTPAAAEAGGEA